MPGAIIDLAADPYYFNNSKYFEKSKFVSRDVERMMDFFNKSPEVIFEASKSYVGREESLYLFVTSIKFWQNAIDVQLTEKSTNLSTLVAIVCAESMLGNQLEGNSDRFRNFLINFLSISEKIELISGYTFGAPHELGQGKFRRKHLCHRAAILSESGQYYNRGYCSTDENPLCACRQWLQEANTSKVDRYVNMFGGHIYNMRNSVVHDAGFVQFTSMPFIDEELGEVIPTTADSYSDHRRKKYTSYETDVTVQRYHEIMKNAAWRCFERGSKIRYRKSIRPLSCL